MAVHNSANNTVSVQTTFPEGMGGARYDPDRHGYRIYVGNLPHDTCHDDLARLFLTFGPIVDIWLASNPPGFGFVVFKNAADAETAVLGKNCTVFRGMIMKVQHARMFKDRFIKPFHKGRRSATGSDTSKSRSRSRSLSRSSRSRSRSSSRLRHISKIYGSSRTRSRSPLRQESKSRSRSRSGSSTLTSMTDSSSRSRSRSVPRHGYSSSEGSDGKHSSSKNRHNRCHRRHRSTRRRSSLPRKRRSNAVTEKTRHSSTRSHSASSSPQYSRSSSRSDISSAHDDKRQHHHHRHTRHSSPEDSASSQSASSANDGKDSSSKVTGKSRRKRKRKRSHMPKRDWSSSSLLSSASSSSSSSSSSSPVPGRRRKKEAASAEARNWLSRKPQSALVQEDDTQPDLPATANHHTSTAMSPSNSISPLLPSDSPPVISPAHTSLSNTTIPDTESAFSTFGTCPETPAVVDPVSRTVDPSFRTASAQKSARKMSSLSSLNTCQTCAQPEKEDALCEISLSCESVIPSGGNVSVTTSTVAPYIAVLQNSSSKNSALTGPTLTVESDCVGTINHPIPTSISVLDAPTFRSSIPTLSSNDLSSLHSPGTSQGSDHTVTRLITSIAVRHPSSSIAISECLSVMAAALNVPDTTSVQLKTTSTTTSADRLVSTAPILKSQFQQNKQCGCQYHAKHAVHGCGGASADSERTAGEEGSGAPCDDDGSGRHSVSSTIKMTAGGALLQHFDFYPGTSSESVKDVVKENPIDNSTKQPEFRELERQTCSLRASRHAPLWATEKEQGDLVNISENHVELTKNCTRKMPITGYDFVNDDAMMENETPDIPTLSDSGSNYKQNGLEQQNTKLPKTTLATKNACEKNSPKGTGNHTQGKLPASFTAFSIENRKTADMKHVRAVPEKQDNLRFIPRQSYEQIQHSAKHVSEDNKISDKDTFFTDPWNSPPSQVSKSCTRIYRETTHQPGLWEAANMDDYSYHVTPGFHSSHKEYEQNSLHTANRRQKMHIKLHSTVLPSANDRPQPGARETDRQTTDPDFQFRKGEMDDAIQRHALYYRSTRPTSPIRHGLPDTVTPTCSCSENSRSTSRIKHQHFAHTSGANHLHRNYRHSSDVGSEETVFDRDRSRWTSASYAKDITYVENHRRRWSEESSDSSTESKSRERNDSRTKAKSMSQDQLKRGFRPAKTEDRNHNSRTGS